MYFKNPIKLSIAILDFKRQNEFDLLMESLDKFLKIPAEIVYCHDGPVPEYALNALKSQKIHTLISTSANRGCGIQTRQLFQACMTEYVLYCQVDQFLIRDFGENEFRYWASIWGDDVFYVDLAGNQGHGNASERASIFRKKDYLSIPKLDDVIGGPGPFANYKWTEQHLQEYMRESSLRFITTRPVYFMDNGKWSYRAYPCGGETLHSTDEKVLKIIKPLKQKYNFPNLKLSEQEWQEVLENRWPEEGKIPTADLNSSFKVW